MSFAMVFPGQGSHSVGMLSGLAAEPLVRATFSEASAVLGYDLWQLTQHGPEAQLNATEQTQPAMLTAAVAIWRLWSERGGRQPVEVLGHSLGEFTALTCAGAFDFAEAVELVRDRGRLMQEAVPEGTGAMAAVLGLEDAQVAQACAEAAQGAVVEPVNYNAPGQVVIAGEKAAVERAIEAAKRLGAKRALVLPLSVPAHSSLMRAAADQLADKLRRVSVRPPHIPYRSAVDASLHQDPADIRELLVRQLASPVRWTDTVRALSASGVRQVIECGPGKVLTALNRRIERRPDFQCLAIDDIASIETARAAVDASGESHA
jgi:[acyl-carrier-protein] S-malonyltransferase